MKKGLLKLCMLVALLAGSFVSANAFTDIKLDLTDGNFLTESELGGAQIKFGVIVGEDGTPTRVDATDANANIVLSGKYHSNEHGWGYFSSTFAVEGPVKISMGTCAWGGDVTIKGSDGTTIGTFTSNTGACYHQDKEANIASYIYKGGADNLTVSGGSYTPYFAVEAVDPSTLVDDIIFTFVAGEAQGEAPAAEKVEVGKTITLPLNRTLYVEGKTLTGWSDGTAVYAPGAEVVAPATDVTLTPVFTPNNTSLATRTAPVTVVWDFQRRNGAPLLAWQGVTGVYVTQAEVGGETIDVALEFDTTNGKIANGSWVDWAQFNSGTKFVVPSAKGAVVSMEAYGEISTTTIEGATNYTPGNTIEATIAGEGETAEIVIGNGSYYRYISVAMPDPKAASFRDIVLDLTDGNYLTEAELGGSSIRFGVKVEADGTNTRVAYDDADANIQLMGKFHSNEHGWGNFASTVTVPGPVKISMGSCAWGGDVTIKNGSEVVATFNTNIGKCYHQDKENNIVSYLYKGGAATLSISGGSYTPYFAVEYVDPATIVDDVTLTFDLGNTGAQGDLPETVKAEPGAAYTLPDNHTLYLEGHTLVGWTDGANEYLLGSEIAAPETDVTLTPIFRANTSNLADRKDAVTVRWDFQKKNGAPTLGYQGVKGIYVAQAEVNGELIDVKMDFDTSAGKLNNGNWNDWAQVNSGTVFTIPSCKGAVVSMEAYSTITTTTIDGMTDYAQGNTITYTIGGDAATIDVVIGDGSYYRYIQTVLPYVAPNTAGTVYENADGEVAWAFSSSNDFADNYTVVPEEAFSVVSVNTGDLEITGAAKRTADDLAEGITFVKFKPSGETKAVEWYVKPVKGVEFTPTQVSMWIQRFGTDAEHGVVVSGRTEGGESVALGTFTAPRANQDVNKDKFAGNDDWTNHVVIDIPADLQAAFTSGEGFYLSATVGVGPSKEGGFSDVHIAGKLNGTIADVAKYTVTAQANPEEAATITVYPNAAEFEEGTEVRLTATKNFGYKFINWTDAEGNVVSEKNVFTIEVNSNLDLTANFEAVNTYALNYAVEGGANLYMVTPVPAPTVIDGKNMYEDGTNVVLTASSNPILTFTNWSDGQTAAEITVPMTQDVDITAIYSAVDFVAGWDFILAGNNGRPADFAAEDNDADVLVLRDAEGTTVGWLDKSQANGGYEGRPGGVNWRTDGGLGHYYWQTKVNAAAFTDLRVITAMVYNYNAYQTYKVEYSLDDENWTTLGLIEMPGVKSWTDVDLALPADANNQAEVYIRVIADLESAVDGTSSNNDGATIGATYIVGTAKLVDDGTAPVVVATVPAEGATNASANGKIVVTFDEKVKVAEDAVATLGDLKLTPKATGKTVTVEYRGLAYATDYTFTLPAGSVMDLTDNAIANDIVVNFTTRTKPEVQKALYDFVVPDDGTFKEAISAANSRADKSTRFRIFVKQGYYVLPVNEGSSVTGAGGKTASDSRTDLTASYVSIIGEGMEITSIKNDCPDELVDGAYPGEGLRNCYTLHNSGVGTYIQDIKLINGIPDNTGRGEAYEESGDKTILKNVALWGYQDTYCSNNGRARYYFEGGIVRGRTDYICGKDDIYFNGVEFRNVGTGGYISVPSTPKQYGWILRDCRITAEDAAANNGNYTLGRPWGKGTPIALWINTTCEVVPSAIGWSEMSGGWPARFAEYNSMTSTGTAIDLSGRKTIFADTHENNPVLTAEEADFYTIAQVMGADDDWDPTEATEQASAPTNVALDELGNLTWDNSNYVLLWAVCKDGKVVAFTVDPVFVADDQDATWSVRAANEMGGLGEAAIAEKKPSGLESLTGVTVDSTVYYNVQGVRVNANYQGVVIRVDRLSDGTTRTTKMIKK